MTRNDSGKLDRREFLKQSTAAAVAFSTGLSAKPVYAARKKRTSASRGKKIIVLGIDGMDPYMSERLMGAGLLPNFDKLRKLGGYRRLGTSIPPQSPVAWANFITGAGPGTHGIFDFTHRNPQNQYEMRNSISYIKPGEGVIGVGDHLVQLSFWPFNHTPPQTILGRKGVPFWDYLDEAGISSHIYLAPSNYPPSPSKYGHHRSLSGLGTPDVLGTSGTYHHFAEDRSVRAKHSIRGKFPDIVFKNDTAQAELFGPQNIFLKKPGPTTIKFLIHRDRRAKTAVIEIQNHRILLKEGSWSDWIELNFELSMPIFIPDKNVSGICRFYLQEVAPNFRLYVSPININPANPAMRISEPPDFSRRVSKELGLFYTIGFQEDYMTRIDNTFSDEEYAEQTDMVLQERLKLLEYALEQYEDGVLFFYFSSTDLQAHMFWWDSYEKHPFRSRKLAMKYNNRIKELYKKMDGVLGDILKRYSNGATIFALSDHGFAHFKRVFNLNTWLRSNGYIRPPYCTTLNPDETQRASEPGRNSLISVDIYGTSVGVDWSKIQAYGLGVNGLYLNLKGREREGIVEPHQREELLQELVTKLEAVRDVNGDPVIRKVYRADQVYSGPEMELAPDLVIGYYRGYRADLETVIGYMTKEVLRNNTIPWTADHCFDPREVPGVLFCSRPIHAQAPTLVDLAPSILTEFGLKIPSSMEGKNIFTT